jgi:hypothetical protein
LIFADDPDTYHLLSWALRDDGIDVLLAPLADAATADMKDAGVAVIASEEAAQARRELVALLHARAPGLAVIDRKEGSLYPATGADLYVDMPLRHDVLTKALARLGSREQGQQGA